MSTQHTQQLNKFVRAGAGAGKTWNLTREVVSFAESYYQREKRWPHIVLTTFTRKATQELKERILTYILEEKSSDLLPFVESSSYLTITTMHGLLNLYLSRYGQALGLASQIQISDRSALAPSRKKILLKTLEEYRNQQSKIEFLSLYKIVELIDAYEPCYWQKDISSLSVEDIQTMYLENLNQYLDQLKYYGRILEDSATGEGWVEYLQEIKAIETDCQSLSPQELRKSFAKRKKPSPPRKSKKNPSVDESIIEPIKKNLQELFDMFNAPENDPELWPLMVSQFKSFEDFARSFHDHLFSFKIREGKLEANDLEYFSLRLQSQFPDTVTGFSQDYDAWFIDEFQDTSPLQLTLLERFINGKSHYLVGDPQQSIYLFRGSRSEVFLNRESFMRDQGAEIIALNKNYRSNAPLLDFINSFFKNLGDHFSTMIAERKAPVQRPSVSIFEAADQTSEQECAQLTLELDRWLKLGVSPKDICFLGRTHKDLLKLQSYLSARGYPVMIHSSSQFYSRREVIDAMALLIFLINPWDNLNLLTLVRSPWLAMGDEEIFKIVGSIRGSYWPHFRQYWQEQKETTPGRCLLHWRQLKKSKGIAWTFRRALIGLGALDLSVQVDATGRSEANLWKVINQVERIAREPGGRLLELARQGLLTKELEDVGDGGDAESPNEPNKINLMTIHASKGLQFDYVLVPFLQKAPRKTAFTQFCIHEKTRKWSMRLPIGSDSAWKGSYPEKNYLRTLSLREQEESERLLYVAMTRAREELILSWTGEPQKQSWGCWIKEYATKNPESELFTFTTIDSVEESRYQSIHKNFKVRAPWQQRDRFSLSSVETVDQSQASREESQFLKQEEQRWRGVFIHKLFESLKDHSYERVLQWAKREEGRGVGELSKALGFIQSQSQVPLLKIIENGQVEWPYRIFTDQEESEKRVDLWGIVDGVLWIVDYKTGSSRYREKAKLQLEEYARDLKVGLAWPGPIRKVALYPLSEEIFIF